MNNLEITKDERANFRTLLNDIESTIIEAVDTPFTPTQIKKLDKFSKDIWQAGIKIQFVTALDELEYRLNDLTFNDHDGKKINIELAKIKDEICEDMCLMLNYDRLVKMDIDDFKIEADRYLQTVLDLMASEKQQILKIQSTSKSKAASHELTVANTKYEFYKRYAESLQAGIYTFNSVSKKISSQPPESNLKLLSKSIFTTAGAFVGAVCGVISAPIYITSCAIGGAMLAGTVAGLEVGAATTNLTESEVLGNLASVVGFVVGAPLGLIAGTVAAIRTLTFGTNGPATIRSPIVVGASIGKELGKRYSDQDHSLRITLLNSIYTLRINGKQTNELDTRAAIIIKMDDAINSFLGYLEILSQQAFTKKQILSNKGNGGAISKEIADIAMSIQSHLNLELEQLRKSYTDAVTDGNIKALGEISSRIDQLERDWQPINESWQSIKTGTNKNETAIDTFCRAATTCMQRLKLIHAETIHKDKSNYDFSKEKKTKLWSEYNTNNNAGNSNQQFDEIIAKINTIQTNLSLSKP